MYLHCIYISGGLLSIPYKKILQKSCNLRPKVLIPCPTARKGLETLKSGNVRPQATHATPKQQFCP
jgi:hypothetical protein